MRTPLYAIDDNVTPENYYLPCPERNVLNLLPEHRVEIDTAFFAQLMFTSLNVRQTRIVTAIFRQTVCYDKFEDDMNGTRIEQLTGIRGDHANEIVRELEGNNVLITRRGHYGKWLSINFNFEQWGQLGSVSGTNDPTCLLSDAYKPMTEDEIVEFELRKPPQSVNKNNTVATPIKPIKPVNPPVETPVATPVETSIEIPVEIPVTIPMAIEPEVSLVSTQAISLATPENPVSCTNPSPIITTTVAPAPAPTPAPVLAPAPAPAPATASIPKEETSVPPVKEAVETPTIKITELNYPESISQKLRHLLAKHLKGFKILEQAQRLLNYFAKCLKERDIRNPIAYFIALKNRLLNGQLDLDETEYQYQHQQHVDSTKKAQAERTQAQIAYQNAVLELQQVKKVIEFIREEKKCTFEEALRAINYVDVWKKANDCLNTTKEALKKIQFQPG